MFSLWNPAGFWTGPASAPTCFSVAVEKFITGCYSRHENSSEFAHIIKINKKKNAGENYKNTGSGLGAKLHEQYYVSTRFHAHSQTQTPNDITESHQTNSSKIICVFSIPGTMFWKYIFTDTNSKVNSTPLLKVSLHAFSHDAHQYGSLPPCTNQFFYDSKCKSLVQGRVRWNHFGDYFKP